MKRALLSILTVFAILALTVPSAHATPTTSVTWGTTPVGTTVPQGQDVQILVWGPPNGTFVVSVSEQPFNFTPPILTQTFHLPFQANDTGYAATEITVSTFDLYIGPAQIQLWNDTTGVFSAIRIHVAPTLNETNLWEIVQGLWNEQNVTTLREQGIVGGDDYIRGLYQGTFIVFLVGWGILFLYLLFRDTRLRFSKFALWVGRLWHRMWKTESYSDPPEGRITEDRGPAPRPSYHYVSKFFENCPWGLCHVPLTEAAQRDHLRIDHGIEKPEIGVHYEAQRAALASALAATPVARPSPKLTRKLMESDVTDFSEFR